MSILEKIKSRFTRASLIRTAQWAGFTAFAVVHIVALALALYLLPMGTIWWLVPLMVVFPGIVTMTLIPGGWKRWYRWAALLVLVLMVLEANLRDAFIIVLFGETWILHRAWIIERAVPVRHLFRRGKAEEPVCFKPGPKGTRRPKTA